MTAADAMCSTVDSTIWYLQRDALYEKEKPFTAEFDTSGIPGASQSNFVLLPASVSITGLDGDDDCSERFSLERNGFCVVNAETHVPVDEIMDDPSAVENEYLSEVAGILARLFPEYRRIEPFEFSVRKRHAEFPSESATIVTHQQPACVAHSDYSTRGAMLQLEQSFPGQTSYFDGKEFDMLNVWRPLVGPNNDWPLAVCDFTSIVAGEDSLPADRLHEDSIGENELLLPNRNHRWYYIKNQQPHHLIVFRNTDSTGKRARAFHAAFHNTASKDPPRRSCEARFVAIR